MTEKLHYMHANPVIRGLVKHPKDWPWSSWAFYQKGEPGLIPMDVEEREEHANPRPRFPHRTWGTLRVVLICECAKVSSFDRREFGRFGIGQPGHPA
jgi:hypothetical protein